MDFVQNMRISNLEQSSEEDASVIHFSIDDVIEIFRDLTKNQEKYQSAFENDTLKYLKSLHEQYGMQVTLYCFYEFSGFSLSECTDKFAGELSANKEWLKFGFHAYDQESYMDTGVDSLCENYRMTAGQLQRITGCEEADLSKVLRLDRFAGTREQLMQLEEQFGIRVFFTADDDARKSYYLETDALGLLAGQDFYRDENLFFTPTDIRLENIESSDHLDRILEAHREDRNLVIFTHEWKLDRRLKTYICQVAEYGLSRQYRFSEGIIIDGCEDNS